MTPLGVLVDPCSFSVKLRVLLPPTFQAGPCCSAAVSLAHMQPMCLCFVSVLARTSRVCWHAHVYGSLVLTCKHVCVVCYHRCWLRTQGTTHKRSSSSYRCALSMYTAQTDLLLLALNTISYESWVYVVHLPELGRLRRMCQDFCFCMRVFFCMGLGGGDDLSIAQANHSAI